MRPQHARRCPESVTIAGRRRSTGDAPARRLCRGCGRLCAIGAALSRAWRLLAAVPACGCAVAVRHVCGRGTVWCSGGNVAWKAVGLTDRFADAVTPLSRMFVDSAGLVSAAGHLRARENKGRHAEGKHTEVVPLDECVQARMQMTCQTRRSTIHRAVQLQLPSSARPCLTCDKLALPTLQTFYALQHLSLRGCTAHTHSSPHPTSC